MNRRLVLGGALTVALLGATGIGVAVAASDDSVPSYPAYSPPPSHAANSAVTVMVARTGLGETLVDGGGRTLYLFEADSAATSTCYGACASAWPPATTTATPHTAGAASATRLGTIPRTGGASQLTYNDHPLYYYAGDARPGDTAGQGLLQFGAEWYVLNPDGTKIDNG